MNVTFVPFHTPHADSFCHSWAITSRSESARLRSSLRVVDGDARVGVCERERLCTGLCRLLGDCGRESLGEKAGCGRRGAVVVKYPGESSSLSSDGY
jgi:hypothetical protein